MHLRCGSGVENQQIIAYPDTNAWKNHFEFILNLDEKTISPVANRSLVLGFRSGDIRLVPPSSSDAIVLSDMRGGDLPQPSAPLTVHKLLALM